MPKPIYSRIFAEDEDNLPASQIIDEVGTLNSVKLLMGQHIQANNFLVKSKAF